MAELPTVTRGPGVPLSEDEQRILHEIERQFYEQDPAFAREVGTASLYKHAGRNLKWSTVGFLGGLVLMWASFASSLLLGFSGFVVMLACAIIFERNLRKMGRAGWNSMTRSMGSGGLRNYLGDRSKRMRDRFKKEDE
jgi:hypothetical protein